MPDKDKEIEENKELDSDLEPDTLSEDEEKLEIEDILGDDELENEEPVDEVVKEEKEISETQPLETNELDDLDEDIEDVEEADDLDEVEAVDELAEKDDKPRIIKKEKTIFRKPKREKLKKTKETKPESGSENSKLKMFAIVILTVLITVAAVLGVIYYLNQGNVEDVVQEEQPEEVVEEEVLDEFVYITSENGLNMREEPNADAPVLEVIPFATRIPVLEEEGDWIKTEYNDQEGWVWAEFTQSESPLAYKNEKEGFQLTLGSGWERYKVFEKLTDWGKAGKASTYYFSLPTSDTAWKEIDGISSGYASFFAITVFTKEQWDFVNLEEGPRPQYLETSKSGKVITWSPAQAAPTELASKSNDVKKIIETFRLI
jgi:hypothetical protein